MKYWLAAVAGSAAFMWLIAATQANDERAIAEAQHAARTKAIRWSDLDAAGRRMTGFDRIGKK